MRLTTKGRFAVTAMIDLALRSSAGPVALAAISQRQQISLSYLEQLFGKLRRHELVESTRGKQGGFRLARPAHLISFGDIIRVIEGPLALVPCVSRTAYKRCKDCRDEESCEIRRAMMVVRDDTARILDGTSLARAVAEEQAAA